MRTGLAERATTLEDIAKRAGVARSTVSGAFTGKRNMTPETRELILSIARELKFVPNPHAQRLSQGRSNDTIGLFILDLNLGTGVRKARLIQNALFERGYEVPLYGYSSGNYINSHDEGGTRQTKLMVTLCRQQPRVIVCNTSALHPKAMDELRRYQDIGGVVVCYDEEIAMDFDRVIFDRADSVYQAVSHLAQSGHRAVGFASTFPSGVSNPRLPGYWRALREFDLAEREEWLFNDLLPYEEGGAQLAERFTALAERPTAMCIVNDWTAATFVLELQRRGLQVPGDVNIVSLDDTPAARYAAVPLTAVSQPLEEICDAVVELVMSRLEGRYDGAPRQVTVRGELTIRQSTKRSQHKNKIKPD